MFVPKPWRGTLEDYVPVHSNSANGVHAGPCAHRLHTASRAVYVSSQRPPSEICSVVSVHCGWSTHTPAKSGQCYQACLLAESDSWPIVTRHTLNKPFLSSELEYTFTSSVFRVFANFWPLFKTPVLCGRQPLK